MLVCVYPSPKDDAGMLLEEDVSDFYRIASGLKTPKADDNEVLFVYIRVPLQKWWNW